MTRYGGDHAFFKITLGTLFIVTCVTFLAVVVTHGMPGGLFPILTGIAIWLGSRK